MNKIYLMKKSYLFQGEKYLKLNRDYFEGWYFKNTSLKNSISFIPGISITKDNKKAFIQVITNHESYFIDYDINDFYYNHDPFCIRIKNNYFSKDGIHIDINDIVKIKGELKYTNSVNIKNNIMGPFTYMPFMECNHSILTMKNKIDGSIKLNNKKMKFKNGIGYIEKDFGVSFPKSYVWLQGNNFKNKDAAFMFSKAFIPFKIFNFDGFICSLLLKDKEYRFATYNNSKIIKYDSDDSSVNIILKNKKYILEIYANCDDGHNLIAPVKGKMKKNIKENINGNIKLILKYNNKIIFQDESRNCGVEIVN